MGLADFLKRIFGGGQPPARSGAVRPSEVRNPAMWNVAELARRLGVEESALTAVRPSYSEFHIPKRSGGQRTICAPADNLKQMQQRILHRLLGRLKCHPAATGFRCGHSIVTHALRHQDKAVVLRMDIRDFFPSTRANRVREYFAVIGWDKPAVDVLVKLCTWKDALPQGAPTSPALSNLVNHRLDCRLEGLAEVCGATYTRYADDMTFSFEKDEPRDIHALIGMAKVILEEQGYQLHQKRKLQIRRRYERQLVTGLVVNDRVNLPRHTRRWLRAVEHHQVTGRQSTLTKDELQGWQALRTMIAQQAGRA